MYITCHRTYVWSLRLSRPVKRRVRALKSLQYEFTKLETEFYREVQQLEAKYSAKYQPLFDKVQADTILSVVVCCETWGVLVLLESAEELCLWSLPMFTYCKVWIERPWAINGTDGHSSLHTCTCVVSWSLCYLLLGVRAHSPWSMVGAGSSSLCSPVVSPYPIQGFIQEFLLGGGTM